MAISSGAEKLVYLGIAGNGKVTQQGAVRKLTPNFRVASPILLVATIRLRVGSSLMKTAQMNHALLCSLKGSHCRGKGQNGNVLSFIFIICK